MAAYILKSNIENYLYPQYSLPWNNFYSKIDSIPFNLKSESRISDLRLSNTPLSFSSDSSLYITATNNALPDFTSFVGVQSSYASSQQTATKTFMNKQTLTSDSLTHFYNTYEYQGTYACVNYTPSGTNDYWLILSLNLKSPLSTTSVDTNICSSQKISNVTGSISITSTVSSAPSYSVTYMVSPTDVSTCTSASCPTTNTYYLINGKKIWFAIFMSGTYPLNVTSFSYDISVVMDETFNTAYF